MGERPGVTAPLGTPRPRGNELFGGLQLQAQCAPITSLWSTRNCFERARLLRGRREVGARRAHS